jgi:hypothetical protein
MDKLLLLAIRRLLLAVTGPAALLERFDRAIAEPFAEN